MLVEGSADLAGLSGEEAATKAAELADGSIQPASDIHGSTEYRRHLTRELVKRALNRALEG